MGARRESESRKDWLNERKIILQKIKDQVRLYLGPEPKDVSLYAQSYKNDINRPWTRAKLEDIHVCLQQADIALGGDFHPFAQAQRAHLRIIRQMVGERPMILGLECLFAQDQKTVDQFLSGEISEEDFLEKVDWDGKWGFPWKHYKPLFEFAKQNKIKILALNVEVDERTASSLCGRDERAGEILLNAKKANPDHLIYALYGDLHIAQNHLPGVLKKKYEGTQELQVASIYLNSESIYFELAAKQKESLVEVVKFDEFQFCVLSSPPWVKWQSYLMYLEENFDVDLDADEDEWEFQVDHTDHVSHLVGMIAAALQMEFKGDDIEVYSLNDPQVLRTTKRMLSEPEHELAHSLVNHDQSFYLPQEGFFYLSKSTVNHAASLAGQYVHGKLSNRQKVLWDFPGHFLPQIWVETACFFLSKLVNPKRKAQTMGDLKKQLKAFDVGDKGREPLLLALDQKMSELLYTYAKQDRNSLYRPSEKSSYLLAARFIGEMLGERYFKLYQKQKLGVEDIVGLLRQDLNSKDFESFYFEQLRYLDQQEADEGVFE